MSETERNKSYGRVCVFMARSCGTLTAIIGLICGFVALIPLPTEIAGSIPRCIPTGLLLIVCAVVMFFLEAAVLGYCFEKMSFLIKVSKYANSWVRFVLYLLFAVVPILIWCISASTLICLGLFFVVSALNFILAIGLKGDHASMYEKVSLADLKKLEGGEDTEDSETTSLPTHKDSLTL